MTEPASLTGKPLFGDFLVLILMTVGAYILLFVTVYNAFEAGAVSSAQEAGEGTVMGMIITGCFMVIQRNQELIKDRWHQMQTAAMTEQLHSSTPHNIPVPKDILNPETPRDLTSPPLNEEKGLNP